MNSHCLSRTQLWQFIQGILPANADPAHLDQCEQCRFRFAELRNDFVEIRQVDTAHLSSEMSTSQLPCRIGEYLILSRINQGGQADVYRAWHPRLKIDVVIKWFRHEERQIDSCLIRKQCALRHPNLCHVYDFGIEEGRPFQVMEYISGHNLDHWIGNDAPSLLYVLTKLVTVAYAIESIHQQGSLHLDIKPENILIDHRGIPRVIDVGMAQHQQGKLKCLSVTPGTPEYMAPEQFVGDVSRIGVGADVYGLGAVLFRILSGQTVRDESRVNLEPDWRLLRNSPWRLRRICEKALALHHEQRYKSVNAFAQDLEKFIQTNHQRGRVWSSVAIVLGIIFVLCGVLSPCQNGEQCAFPREPQLTGSGGRLSPDASSDSAAAGPVANCRVLMTPSIPPTLIANRSTLHSGHDPESLLAWSQQSQACQDLRTPFLLLECPEAEWSRFGCDLTNPMATIPIPVVKSALHVEITAHSIDWKLRPGHQQLATWNPLLQSLKELQRQFGCQLPRFRAVMVIPAQ